MRGAVCEAGLPPFLTAHFPATNPMFFPCSCHPLHTENPRALTLTALQRLPYHSAKTGWLRDKSTWICILTPTVWLVNIQWYAYRSIKATLSRGTLMLLTQYWVNNPSSSASQRLWWTDSGGIRWLKIPVHLLHLKHLPKCKPLRSVDNL